jgi:hypothetical protein
LARNQKRAMIQMTGGERMKGVGIEGHVPVLITEYSIQADQSWSATYIAPHVLLVLLPKLLQLTERDHSMKTTH